MLPFVVLVAIVAAGLFVDSAVSQPAPAPVRDYTQPTCPLIWHPPGSVQLPRGC